MNSVDIAVNGSDASNAHCELHVLHTQLQKIYDSMSHFKPLTARPPILDSSLDLGNESAEDSQWLQQEHIPGLRAIKDSVKRDLDVLQKFLDDPESANLPALSTNAPYLIAVWNEVLCAVPPIVSIFKSIPLAQVDTSSRKRVVQKPPGTKIDVVSDNGRRWIRINTIKNARILAEFREIDSYFTDSDSDSDDDQPSLAQKEFDNSVLQMGRSLIAAAKANPVEGTSEIPQVTLRLTRLDPTSMTDDGREIDSRIALTIQRLHDMGVTVELGEREVAHIPAPESFMSSSPSPSLCFQPTTRINLDLSVLIALVSDMTHSPLPTSVDEANERFNPPPRYREWKQQRVSVNGNGGKNREKPDESIAAVEPDNDLPRDLAKHSRALSNQVLQEMGKGLLQELHDRLYPQDSSAPDLSTVEFWTTPEARDRFIRIVSKIGGPNEKRRACSLFPSSSSQPLSQKQLVEDYWRGSRYPPGLLPILPIHLHPSSVPDAKTTPSNPRPLPQFFTSLAKTCEDILAQETVPHPRAIPEEHLGNDEHTEIQRATVTKANPRLTAHTVKSMMWGAELGWTTLTANKTSVKAILREMKAAKVAGRLAVDFSSTNESEVDQPAAIWIVDPRSLAEGMRTESE